MSSLLALFLCAFIGIGAPPSEFVREPTIWTRLEPLMWPCLFGGVGLAVLASGVAPFAGRVAALICLAACVMSMMGVVFAWGVDAQGTFRSLVAPFALLLIPACGAIDVIRRSGRRSRAISVSSSSEGAG